MYCRNCGKQLDEGVSYCPYCGTATFNAQPVHPAQPVQPMQSALPAQPVQPVPPVYVPQTYRQPHTNGLAIAGFVLAVVSFILGLLVSIRFGSNYYLSFISLLAIPAFVLSILGLVFSKRYNSGKGLAIAGIVISGIYVAFLLLMIVIFLIYFLLMLFIVLAFI